MWPFRKELRFKSLLVEGKYKVIPAFILGDVQYYMFEDVMNMATGRALMAQQIYDEFKYKADKEYLLEHVAATEKMLEGKDGKITINHLMVLKEMNFNLKERLNLVALPEFIYKLASVHFFDASESVYDYDQMYNAKKIEIWKQNKEALGFFLTQPLRDYLSFLDSSSSDVLKYLNAAEKIAAMHHEKIRAVLSKKE